MWFTSAANKAFASSWTTCAGSSGAGGTKRSEAVDSGSTASSRATTPARSSAVRAPTTSEAAAAPITNVRIVAARIDRKRRIANVGARTRAKGEWRRDGGKRAKIIFQWTRSNQHRFGSRAGVVLAPASTPPRASDKATGGIAIVA